ncbi:MAG: ribosomal-processing cysteine protease Prp [Oscillospiraceae bacterium]|nr:ribosomal-processing cysteine protease Prp [Oscillospiraceae bacterium]
MTRISFRMEGGRVAGVTASGHSGYAADGEDIVCAAITSAVRLTECALNDVLGIGAAVKVRERDASVSIKLPGGLGEQNEQTCQTLLTALMLHLSALRDEYPDHLTVLADEDTAR